MSELPTSIGPYQIQRELGRGGMGIVYLALDPRLGRHVAIKLLPADLSGDPERRARLRREAHALAALNHPNIATLHALDEADGRLFLVMEHIEGDSLAAAIGRARTNLQSAVFWCDQIARALAAAHDAGILHRDLKPANIRIRADGLVKVLDFGLARSVEHKPTSLSPTVSTIGLRTVAGGVLGTPGYLAPEQARGEEVDRRADVFSFGCVLFECLTARPAFRGGSNAELIAAVMRDEPDWSALPHEVPAAVRRLLERCLAKDPQNRLRDLTDAALELRDAFRVSGTDGIARGQKARPTPNNLPRELTSLVGRESELETVAQLLASSPLVTLIGSGGCGKTRLALRAARAALATFTDGVWFIDLSSITNPADVAGLAVRTVGVPASERSDLPHEARLAAALAKSHALLVLDNAEHVLETARSLAHTLVASCPEVHLLVTSREALRLPFEQSFRVPSLSIPEGRHPTAESVAASESGRLFIERARLADPTFRLDPTDAPVLADLCTRLDGIALAIELAAARTADMSLRDLDARLGDALRVLAPASTGGAVPRHATIRAAIEWSVNVLGPDEAALFQQLAVFSGGWTLAAAEAVCRTEGNTGDTLARLVARSLVQLQSATGRYRFLETVRQFAAERLARTPRDAVHARHAEYFATLAERSAEATPGSSSTSLSAIDDDVENIHIALHFLQGLPAEDDRLARLAFAMHKWWNLHGAFDQGLKWLTIARNRRHGQTEQFDGRLAAASGNLEWSRGRFAAARPLFEDALTVFQRLGDDKRVAAILSNIAITNDRLGDTSAARECHERAVSLYIRIGDQQGLAFARLNVSSLLIHESRYHEAITVLEACLPVLEQLGDRHRSGVAFHNLGEAKLRSGDPHSALTALQQAVQHRQVAGDRNGTAHSQLLVALCLAELEDPSAAAAALGRASRLCSRLEVEFSR